jgi:hypothetical protein
MREYYELFRYLMEQRGLLPENILYVGNVAEWCREHDIKEPDKDKPVKLVSEDGTAYKMLVREEVSEETLDQRIRAARIRDQIESVASQKADLLNSIHRKLAFLFLREYAVNLTDAGTDDILADEWAFGEMERLGYFKT